MSPASHILLSSHVLTDVAANDKSTETERGFAPDTHIFSVSFSWVMFPLTDEQTEWSGKSGRCCSCITATSLVCELSLASAVDLATVVFGSGFLFPLCLSWPTTFLRWFLCEKGILVDSVITLCPVRHILHVKRWMNDVEVFFLGWQNVERIWIKVEGI